MCAFSSSTYLLFGEYVKNERKTLYYDWKKTTKNNIVHEGKNGEKNAEG